MSLQEQLQILATNSKKASLVEFNKSAPNVISDVLSRKRKLLREPEAHELKLQALCAGDFTTARLMQGLSKTNNNGSSTKREEIERILKAANALNQICNLPEIKAKIEELAHIHEERQTNLDYLYETFEKNEAEINEMKQNEPVSMDIDDGGYDDSDIREEIERLSREMEEKKAQRQIIQKKKKDQLEIKETLNQMKQKISESMSNKPKDTNDRIRLLEEQVSKQKQTIQELDSKIKALDEANSSATPHPPPNSKIRELNVGFKARIDKLLHSNNLQEPTTTELTNLTQLFATIQKEIQTHLVYLKQIESSDRHEEAARQVYLKILGFYLNHNENENQPIPNLAQFQTLFPNCTLTDTSFIQVSQEAYMLSAILSKLNHDDNNDRSMPLADLTVFVQDVAKQHDYSEHEAIQCIYKLVGLDLVMIDRTQNDSIVRLL